MKLRDQCNINKTSHKSSKQARDKCGKWYKLKAQRVSSAITEITLNLYYPINLARQKSSFGMHCLLKLNSLYCGLKSYIYFNGCLHPHALHSHFFSFTSLPHTAPNHRINPVLSLSTFRTMANLLTCKHMHSLL